MFGLPFGRKTPPDKEFHDFLQKDLTRLWAVSMALSNRDIETAEDRLQEALGKLYKQWNCLDQDGNPFGYATTILRNLAREDWRKSQRRVQEVLMEADDAAEVRHRIDSTGQVEAKVLAEQAMSALTKREFQVIFLRFKADMTEAETATVLGISVGTVKSCTSAAMKKMKKELVEPKGGGG